MKTRLTLLFVPVLMGVMLTSPVSAGLIASDICAGSAYCNGEVNGTIDAWTINSGFSVSDSFVLGSGGTVDKVSFGAWYLPGDTGGTVDWNILTGGPATSAGGTVVASGTDSSLSTQSLGTNGFGDNVAVDSFTLSQSLAAGTYYLELDNAAVPSGNPVYWDQNDGPAGNGTGSIAWESTLGYLTAANDCGGAGNGSNPSLTSGYCSESFAVYTSGTTVPEPRDLALVCSGLVLLAGALRRKLNR